MEEVDEEYTYILVKMHHSFAKIASRRDSDFQFTSATCKPKCLEESAGTAVFILLAASGAFAKNWKEAILTNDLSFKVEASEWPLFCDLAVDARAFFNQKDWSTNDPSRSLKAVAGECGLDPSRISAKSNRSGFAQQARRMFERHER